MYIYAESGTDLYKENDPSDFRIDLGSALELKGDWEVAVLDIDIPKMKKNYSPLYINLYSNICSESIMDGIQRPILYRLFKGNFRGGKALSITTPRYVPLKSNSLRTIGIYILDHKGEKPSFESGRTTCTLHLRKL